MASLIDELLAEARGLQGKSVADSSRRLYESRMRVYTNCCQNELHIEPQPVTVDKMMAFIVFQKRSGKCWSTLSSYIQGFAHHFRVNNEQILTQSMQFKVFKDGLGREMHFGTFPKAKLPFKVEWFEAIVESFPVSMFDNRRFMFLITLAFHGFLRMSELIVLTKKQISTTTEGRLDILIQTSKTDQFGHGQRTYIFDNQQIDNENNFVPNSYKTTTDLFSSEVWEAHGGRL